MVEDVSRGGENKEGLGPGYLEDAVSEEVGWQSWSSGQGCLSVVKERGPFVSVATDNPVAAVLQLHG